MEFGVKTEFHPGYTANFTVFNTDIKDYQTQVVNAQVGVLRGNLANFKVPQKIVVRDSLPRTSSGKLIREADTLLSNRLGKT